MQFCDDDSKRCLVVPENMKVDHVIPSKLSKGKVLLFVKLQSCTLTIDNMAKNITVLELGPNPFEHLELLANEVFLPVLSNPQNQAKWGEVPTREIMDRFHNFLSSTTILCGQIKGETRLPMPPIDLTGGPSTAGKNRISLLEGAIITWTKQIRSVLKQDPESQLKQVRVTISSSSNFLSTIDLRRGCTLPRTSRLTSGGTKRIISTASLSSCKVPVFEGFSELWTSLKARIALLSLACAKKSSALAWKRTTTQSEFQDHIIAFALSQA